MPGRRPWFTVVRDRNRAGAPDLGRRRPRALALTAPRRRRGRRAVPFYLTDGTRRTLVHTEIDPAFEAQGLGLPAWRGRRARRCPAGEVHGRAALPVRDRVPASPPRAARRGRGAVPLPPRRWRRLGLEEAGQVVDVEPPSRPRRGPVQVADDDRREPVDDAAVAERRCAASRRCPRGPCTPRPMLPCRTRRPRLDDGARADVQPWIIAPGPMITSSSMTRSLSGSRCSTAFSRICTRSPMRTGPCESPRSSPRRR